MRWVATVQWALLSAATLACSACNPVPASTAMADGPAVAAPAGWVDYCRRHREDAGCPR